jgi:hypothetical protein
LGRIDQDLTIEHMFVSYNPPPTETSRSSRESKIFFSGD